MAQLALATAGAAVGSFFGPIGASIGWSLGSMIGASFGPKITNDQGPVSDLRYTDSSYGAPLALHYGTIPASRAQVIWTPDAFRAIRHVESSGGKGGPRVESVSYTYETDVAIALSGRECVGVGRIWVDNILRSNFRDDATVDEVLASEQWFDALTFYSGSETQEPDPTMEAALGVGNVPAYRGTCYVVIRGVRCGTAPRLPTIVFEVIADGSSAALGRIVAGEVAGTGTFYNVPSNGHTGVPTLRFDSGSLVWQRDGDVRLIDIVPDGSIYSTAPVTSRALWLSGGTQAIETSPLVYHESFDCALVQVTPGGVGIYFNRNGLLYIGRTETYLPDVANLAGNYNEQSLIAIPGKSPIAAAGCADQRYILVWYTDYDWAIWRVYPDWELVREGTMDIGTDNAYEPNGIACDGDSNAFEWSAACMESNLQHVWIISGNETYSRPGEIFCYEIGADDVMRRVYHYWDNGDPGAPMMTACWADNGLLYVMFSSPAYHATGYYRVHSRLPASGGTVALSTVVSDLYSRTGYSESDDLEVTALTQIVDGYEFSTPRSVRAGIEELRAAFLFDLVESDGKISGVNRGAAAAASIGVDDLGMAEGGALSPALETVRETESEVPFEVMVKYISADGGYRSGAQRAENATTESNEQTTIDLPIVLTDDRAAQLADILRRDRWRSRTTHRLTTSRKYIGVDPADVVTVNDGEAVRTLRVTSCRLNGPIVEWQLVDEGAADYESAAVGGSVSVPYRALRPYAYTDWTLLDAPLLYQLQNGYGVLFAARGYQVGWAGATLFKSADGSSYSVLDSTTVEADLGYTLTALAAPVTTAIIPDETSVITVTLPTSVTPASTDMDGLLSLENVAAVRSGTGWEIVSWRDVTDLGDGQWELTGLLRGLAGTEGYTTGHAAGDRFVILTDSSLIWVPLPSSEVGQAAYYKAPAFGQTLQASLSQSLTFAAVSLKPLAPVHVFASRKTAGGDILIGWVRRGRVDHVMRDYWADAILDEYSESYEIDVLDTAGTVVLRTLTSTTNSVTYSSANQDIDFDAAGNITSLNLRVRQISTRVGDGFDAEVSVGVSLNNLWARNWDDLSLKEQTSFVQSGGSINTYTAASGALRLACSLTKVMWVRMDTAPQIADGFIQADVLLETTTSSIYAILVYRTGYAAFGNTQGCFAYRVALSSTTIYLERGQNNASGGSVTTIDSAAVSIGTTTPSVVRVRFSGSSHRVWVDDELVIDATDATYTAAGCIGLGAQSDSGTVSVSSFDNLSIFTN